MLQLSHTQVLNLENAIRGARNPMNSWTKIDSCYAPDGSYILGPNDLALASKLCKAGSDHRKFLRQIIVSVDIAAPLYWWKEFDTYKIGTVANSTSTMHKIHSKKIGMEDFSTERMTEETRAVMEEVVAYLERTRLRYLGSSDQNDWYSIIQLLPSSYNQLRTCTMNYETLVNIYNARKSHKLDEWHMMCAWIRTLPYSDKLICFGG